MEKLIESDESDVREEPFSSWDIACDNIYIRWPWRSRVIPVWLLLPPCVVMPVPVLPPPSLQFCIGRHASCCPPSRQFLSSHLRHSSRCVRISIIPVLLSPHSSDLPSSVVTPVAVLHHSSEGLSDLNLVPLHPEPLITLMKMKILLYFY